jgi:hypothetical protein
MTITSTYNKAGEFFAIGFVLYGSAFSSVVSANEPGL